MGQYQSMARALDFIEANVDDQPGLDAVAKAVGQIATAVRAGGRVLSLQLQSYDDIPAQLARYRALGAGMIAVPLLGLLLRETERVVAAIRSA